MEKNFINSKLFRLRRRLGLTQQDMASVLCVSQSQVARYESGRNPLPLALALALIAYAGRRNFRIELRDIYYAAQLGRQKCAT